MEDVDNPDPVPVPGQCPIPIRLGTVDPNPSEDGSGHGSLSTSPELPTPFPAPWHDLWVVTLRWMQNMCRRDPLKGSRFRSLTSQDELRRPKFPRSGSSVPGPTRTRRQVFPALKGGGTSSQRSKCMFAIFFMGRIFYRK